MAAVVRPGVQLTKRVEVDHDRTISFMGEEGRVYATPSLVRDIEMTCRELLLQHIDAGEDSVGTSVSIKHLAPSLLGMHVDITVTVTAVEGGKVTLDVTAKDDLEQICSGTHGRFVVNVNKTIERLKAKAAKRAAAPVG